MTAMEHTALGQALRAVVPCIETPTLQKVVDALFNPSLAADGSVYGHAQRLRRPGTNTVFVIP